MSEVSGGLSVGQNSNPDAILLAHENTMDHWSLGHTPVSGGEGICIGGQRLRVICAPVIFIYMIASFEKHGFKLSSIAAPDMCTRFHGHTDGHMALLHVSTHSLIVGDHCVVGYWHSSGHEDCYHHDVC
ncbi:hypothetical protein LOK49_LG05G00643 [Camellia lanceoleosa]|uniref:Uncharacterized protein n=1 Tax=Camellia lanceoleosa TaxID=1840588 RepID=A0ACC0HME8_9ERIC|nr:hypothetical protein LOK49_LG05G00643 [Camellia lanceoleosa]